jgi:hypothetical protein
MHASDILQKCFADVFGQMHASRVRVVIGAVQALVSCRRLVLMDLARAWPGAQRVRAPLKKLDRLLSNPHLQQERSLLYGHIVRWLVRTDQPVIVVDWSTLKEDESWHLLRAGLAVQGRTLTLYEEVHPQCDSQSPRVHRVFLNRLHQLLPSSCRPIIITDAGFRCPWFFEVQKLGWHWVGRARNHVCVKTAEHSTWRLLKDFLHGPQTAVRYGAIQLVRAKPFQCQMLRYRQALKGRKHRTARGTISQHKDSRAVARSQREPWLLVYSNSLQHLPLQRIVNLYKKRMQIELGFRDLKSPRYGCAFHYSLTRKGPRLAMLLLLLALASVLAWLQGVALAHAKRTSHCDYAPSSKRAGYSIVRIGWESLRRGQAPPAHFAKLGIRRVPAWLATFLIVPA